MIPEINKKAKLRYQFYNYYKKFLTYEGTWPEEIIGHDLLITDVTLLNVKDRLTNVEYCSVNFVDTYTSDKYTIIILLNGTYPMTGVIIFEEMRDLIDPDKEMPDFLVEEFLKKDQPEERPQIWIDL